MNRLAVRLILLACLVLPGHANAANPLKIMPLGDSITRGSYLVQYPADGPYPGKAIGRPNPDGGGWRKILQDRLRDAGVSFDFVGELRYHSYGRDGVIDPLFDPDHDGLAGFSNRRIISGGIVPTPQDVLDDLGVKEIVVPDIVKTLRRHQPEVILLMSGANGFDAPARDELIRLIGAHSLAHLFVATIPPQRPPRTGWDQVDPYNASLPAIVAAQQAAGHRITLVDVHTALAPDDLLTDGVHPNHAGLAKLATAWYDALVQAAYTSRK